MPFFLSFLFIIMNKQVKKLASTPSDINEHIPTLYEYATRSSHITEFGTRGALSTYTFLNGLDNSQYDKPILISVDPFRSKEINNVYDESFKTKVTYKFVEASDLEINIDYTDLLFIDSWHCYGQLIRELC